MRPLLQEFPLPRAPWVDDRFVSKQQPKKGVRRLVGNSLSMEIIEGCGQQQSKDGSELTTFTQETPAFVPRRRRGWGSGGGPRGRGEGEGMSPEK